MSEQTADNNNNNIPSYEQNIIDIVSTLHTLEINKHGPERERLFLVHQNERNQVISDIISSNAPDRVQAQETTLSEEAQRNLEVVQALVREQTLGQGTLRRGNKNSKKKKKK